MLKERLSSPLGIGYLCMHRKIPHFPLAFLAEILYHYKPWYCG